MFLKCRI